MPLLVVLLFHETVDLPSVQIRVILRVSVRMPGRLLGLMGWRYDVGRRKASRVRRNGHVHSAIARRQSTPWALQSPPESCHFFPNSRPAIFRPCLFRNNIRRGVDAVVCSGSSGCKQQCVIYIVAFLFRSIYSACGFRIACAVTSLRLSTINVYERA